MAEAKPKGTCFLLAPLGAPRSEVRQRSDLLLKLVIEPVAVAAGYRLVRADEFAAPGDITTQEIRLVMDAQLVIADLSGANPNVMYMLAVRHATQKPVILLTTDASHIPFDSITNRVIVIDRHDPNSVMGGMSELAAAIRESEVKPTDRGTPIAAAINIREVNRRLNSDHAEEGPLLVGIQSALTDINERLKGLEYRLSVSAEGTNNRPFSRRVFIVHGRNGELKNELARLLERLNFEPIILHELADRGDTIFAKLIGQMSDVGFAFVLLTPDDVGGAAPTTTKPRARQNVVFEHGLFVGHLRSDRVCAITKGEIELPSDLHGVLYKPIPSDGSIASIMYDIIKELKAAGYEVDANLL